MAYLSIVQTAKNVDCRNDEYKYFTLKIEFSEKCVSAITEHFWKMPRGQGCKNLYWIICKNTKNKYKSQWI